MVHVHIGTGSLGLGFVAYLTRKAGFRVVLANREVGSASKKKNSALKHNTKFTLKVVGRTTRTESVQIDKFIYTDSESDELLDLFENSSTMLLTTGLKEGLKNCIPDISRLIKKRVDATLDEPLFVLACENRFDSNWLLSEVAAHLGMSRDQLESRQVQFLPCVVDRICTNIECDSSGQVSVEVEPYAKWVIETTEASKKLEKALSLLVNEGIIEFVSDIKPYKLRKLWLINGPHLLVAILARADRKTGVHIFLRESRHELLFRAIQQEFTDAVRFSTHAFSTEELIEFNNRTVSRFQEYPDTSNRIMGRFRRGALETFIKDLDAKVGEPARIILERTKATTRIALMTRTIYQCLRMISAEDYVDE